MQVDIQTYIFKEVEYKKILKSDIRKAGEKKGGSSNIGESTAKTLLNATGLIGAVTVKENYTEKLLLLFATDNQKILQAADLIAQGPAPIYKGLSSAKIQSYKNGSEYIEMNYQKTDGSSQSVLIEVASKRVVSVNGVSTVNPVVT